MIAEALGRSQQYRGNSRHYQHRSQRSDIMRSLSDVVPVNNVLQERVQDRDHVGSREKASAEKGTLLTCSNGEQHIYTMEYA